MDQAMFLVSIERNKRPYTLNGYFNENLQRLRPYESPNLVVDLDVVKRAKANKSSVEYAKEEIHDISSYYEVARKP
ncbi:hypothetical protein Egran_06124 [Elaphomyces granulatus]|uniref:Uncharacterized protein n=1 Tax=Elaphomyces granulatus TaxID=519963 RepID=A0A232LQP3_9EURO|nr:hypothetical protein Egran_06124 [Elaphomyces granulatus]